MTTQNHIMKFETRHVEPLKFALNDPVVLGPASRVQALRESLARNTTVRNVIAQTLVDAIGSGGCIVQMLTCEAEELEHAIAAIRPSDDLIDRLLHDDTATRQVLDAAVTMRSRWATNAIEGLGKMMAGAELEDSEKRAGLFGRGYNVAEVSRILDADGNLEMKVAAMRVERDAWHRELDVLNAYCSDMMRDQSRLGALLPVLQGVSGRTMVDYTLLREWALLGPVDLSPVSAT